MNEIKELTHSNSYLFEAIPPLMRASQKAYGKNSIFHCYIEIISSIDGSSLNDIELNFPVGLIGPVIFFICL